jgi:hypothetical protein
MKGREVASCFGLRFTSLPRYARNDVRCAPFAALRGFGTVIAKELFQRLKQSHDISNLTKKQATIHQTSPSIQGSFHL